jgi:hypothetical protein
LTPNFREEGLAEPREQSDHKAQVEILQILPHGRRTEKRGGNHLR